MSDKPLVVVGMSGGVDSSVAAALLVEQGYRVAGMMLRLWNQPGTEADNRCCTPDAMAQARRVAAMLDIPFYALDAREMFYQQVVRHFVAGYAGGITPNPCLMCNRRIRWGYLLDEARAIGADYLATGHYARLQPNPQGGVSLLRGVDSNKDQSYVLSMLTQVQLQHTLLPLGGMTKPEVRQHARRFKLPVADKADSQDLCFLGSQDLEVFLTSQSPELAQPGRIVNQQGMILGEHRGLAFYTLGQRKGLRIASREPLYVLAKQMQSNTLVVGSLSELGQNELMAGEVNWINGVPTEPVRVAVKIRYRAEMADAWLTVKTPDRVKIKFDQPLRDITPGQVTAFYQGDEVLGGGVILDQEDIG